MFKKFLLTTLIAFASLFFGATSVYASGIDIKISPVSNYFYVKAGDVQTYTMTVSNDGTSDLSYRLYTSAYRVTDSDYTMSFDESSDGYNQIARWVTFKDSSGAFVREPKFTLAPGESQIVTYRISVPDSIPAGGQYCVIFAETINDGVSDGTSINAISRVALSLVGHGTGDTVESGEILDYYMTAPFSSEGISGGAMIRNSGNTDFEAAYIFRVSSIFDKELYESDSSYTVLPETDRRFSVTWENAPMFGIFKARLAIQASDTILDRTRIVVIIPIWLLIILLILLTIIIIWIIIITKKRKQRSTRLVV